MSRTIAKVVAALVSTAAWVAALFGMFWLLATGIEEIVNALGKHPAPGNLIAFGAVKILFCETPLFVAWAVTLISIALVPERRFTRAQAARIRNRQIIRSNRGY